MIRRTSGFLLLSAALLATGAVRAEDTKAFKLMLGDQTLDLDVDKDAEVTLPDGSKARVKLIRNQFATYAANAFSFVHPSDVSVTLSDLGDGVVQHLMTTALGSMVLVQTYDDLDPTSLNELMLNEMTGDSIAAGAKLKRKSTIRTAGDKQLSGISATESLKRDVVDYEILSWGTGDSGVIVITRMDRENAVQDGAKLTKFWEALKIQ